MTPPGDALDRRRAFVARVTRLQSPPAVSELHLHLADDVVVVWQAVEAEIGTTGTPPPFWAFAWLGGQAVARYLLDHPDEVAGRRVLDFATGSGLCALAAAQAGAAAVTAADIDPLVAAAVAVNAESNGLSVSVVLHDLLDAEPPDVDVLIAGDVCYEQAMTARVLDWLRLARSCGTRVLLGDPGRAYLPHDGLRLLAGYDVPTTRDLEGVELRTARVYTLG